MISQSPRRLEMSDPFVNPATCRWHEELPHAFCAQCQCDVGSSRLPPLHTTCEGGSQGRDWGRIPQVSGQRAIKSSAYQPLSCAQCLPGIFSFNPHNNPMSSGVPLSPAGAEGQVCAQGWGGRQGWTQAAGLQVHLPVPHKGYKVLGALKKG